MRRQDDPGSIAAAVSLALLLLAMVVLRVIYP